MEEEKKEEKRGDMVESRIVLEVQVMSRGVSIWFLHRKSRKISTKTSVDSKTF